MELRSDIMNPVGSFEFEMDKDARNAPYVHKPEELKMILAFIRSLGDDALLDWLKDVVRFPHPEPDQKPLFLSGESGCGKGTLVKLARTMIGSANVAEFEPRSTIETCVRYLRFRNTEKTLLIIFNEFEFSGWTRHTDGLSFILNNERQLKAMLDEGFHSRELYSDVIVQMPPPSFPGYHRVLITSHDPPPADFMLGLWRRPLHIRCGNGLVGNDVLFGDLYRLMKDRDVLHTFWDYLKKDRWGCLRRKLRVRAIVLYWLKLTEPLMEPGNAAFARDHAEHEAMWE